MDKINASARGRFARDGVKLHRMTSAECASLFPEAYFDWIYVDGDHQYQAVIRDLKLYLPKVKSGGFITGDDYGNPGWWQDGVTRGQ